MYVQIKKNTKVERWKEKKSQISKKKVQIIGKVKKKHERKKKNELKKKKKEKKKVVWKSTIWLRQRDLFRKK